MNKILLTYFSFIIACLAVIAAFITATTYIQLAVGILLYPVLVFFAYKVFPGKIFKRPSEESLNAIQPPIESAEKAETVEEAQRQNIGISDIDKRVFLKLIGSAGIFLFLFSIFNKKSEGLFFKSLPGSGVSGKVALEDVAGNKIDPAQKLPTDGYNICQVDDDVTSFYGYADKDGAWYVMRVETLTGSFRYTKGDSNFSSNWDNRQNLKYDYFNNVF